MKEIENRTKIYSQMLKEDIENLHNPNFANITLLIKCIRENPPINESIIQLFPTYDYKTKLKILYKLKEIALLGVELVDINLQFVCNKLKDE